MFDSRHAVGHLVDRYGKNTLSRLQHPLRRHQASHKRNTDDPWPGIGVETYRQPGIGVEGIRFPFAVAKDVTGIARRCSPAVMLATDRELLDQDSVQAHLKLLPRPQTSDVADIIAVQPDLDLVFAVGREMMANGEAAA